MARSSHACASDIPDGCARGGEFCVSRRKFWRRVRLQERTIRGQSPERGCADFGPTSALLSARISGDAFRVAADLLCGRRWPGLWAKTSAARKEARGDSREPEHLPSLNLGWEKRRRLGMQKDECGREEGEGVKRNEGRGKRPYASFVESLRCGNTEGSAAYA